MRRLEPTHAERYEASPEEIKRFELRRLQPEGPIHLFRPRPSALAPTGYLGRTIMEFLVMNDALRRAVMRRDGMGEIERIAREAGMRTMYEDGLSKASVGRRPSRKSCVSPRKADARRTTGLTCRPTVTRH